MSLAVTFQPILPWSISAAAEFLEQQLAPYLENPQQKVTLALSGGSSVKLYQTFLERVSINFDLRHVTIILADERWGAPGHADSNETQLRNAGVIEQFEKRGARFLGMLSENAEQKYHQAITNAEHFIVLAGMGDDGHTLGWLPTRTEARFQELYEKPQMISHYTVDPEDSNNPFRERLTLTVAAVKAATAVYVFCRGEKKHFALQKLTEGLTPRYQLPVGELAIIGKVVVVSDFKPANPPSPT